MTFFTQRRQEKPTLQAQGARADSLCFYHTETQAEKKERAGSEGGVLSLSRVHLSGVPDHGESLSPSFNETKQTVLISKQINEIFRTVFRDYETENALNKAFAIALASGRSVTVFVKEAFRTDPLQDSLCQNHGHSLQILRKERSAKSKEMALLCPEMARKKPFRKVTSE